LVMLERALSQSLGTRSLDAFRCGPARGLCTWSRSGPA
jgi:hypothetical protein